MNENIKLFLEKVESDSALRDKFAQVKDPDEAYELASSIQGGFTKEEFIEEMTKIKKAMDETLTDEDLAKSSGGGDIIDTEDVVSMVTSVVVSGIAAAMGSV